MYICGFKLQFCEYLVDDLMFFDNMFWIKTGDNTARCVSSIEEKNIGNIAYVREFRSVHCVITSKEKKELVK